MTLEELSLYFSELRETDEFNKFDRVKPKHSQRPDLHAFWLLDGLLPGSDDLISCSEHDQFTFSIDVGELAKVATKERILELYRCGVRYDSCLDSLVMFT